MPRTIHITLSVVAAILLLSISACGTETTVQPENGPAITPNQVYNVILVTGSTVNLRSGPGTRYSILGQVQRGDSLQVTGGLEDWYRVYVPDLSLFAWIYGPLTSGTHLP